MDAVLAAVQTARSAGDLMEARGRLLALSRRFPQSEHPQSAVRGRALVEAAALGRRTGNAAQAAGELLRVLEREADSEWTPRAHFELGELLLARGDWQEAVDHPTAGAGRLAPPRRRRCGVQDRPRRCRARADDP